MKDTAKNKIDNNKFYMAIFGLFAVEVSLIALHANQLMQAPAWFWILGGFAAYRTARTITYNGVGAPLRERWTVVEPDGSGAGDTVNAKDGHPFGELLACPICTGTHAALLILTAYGFLPALGLALVAGLGLAGVAEFIHWIAEMVEWRAHVSREECGHLVRARTWNVIQHEAEKEYDPRLNAEIHS